MIFLKQVLFYCNQCIVSMQAKLWCSIGKTACVKVPVSNNPLKKKKRLNVWHCFVNNYSWDMGGGGICGLTIGKQFIDKFHCKLFIFKLRVDISCCQSCAIKGDIYINTHTEICDIYGQCKKPSNSFQLWLKRAKSVHGESEGRWLRRSAWHTSLDLEELHKILTWTTAIIFISQLSGESPHTFYFKTLSFLVFLYGWNHVGRKIPTKWNTILANSQHQPQIHIQENYTT